MVHFKSKHHPVHERSYSAHTVTIPPLVEGKIHILKSSENPNLSPLTTMSNRCMRPPREYLTPNGRLRHPCCFW